MTALFGKLVTGLIGRAVTDKITGRLIPIDSVEKKTKGLIQSKTAWGVALMALGPWLAPKLGLDSAGLEAVISQVSVLVGAVAAIYGRIKASGPIG